MSDDPKTTGDDHPWQYGPTPGVPRYAQRMKRQSGGALMPTNVFGGSIALPIERFVGKKSPKRFYKMPDDPKTTGWRIAAVGVAAALLLPIMLIAASPWGTFIDTKPLYFYRWNSGATIGSFHCGAMLDWSSGWLHVYIGCRRAD